MRLMNALPTRRRSGGYALLEALIAVIVASVGFIGAARMQTFGMKLADSGQARQKATLLGYQMTDRIRANQLGFARGRYNDPGTGGAVTCLATGCSPDDMAAADVTLWLTDVAAQLPGGQGKVCIDNTPDDNPKASAADWKCDGVGSVIAVKVAWTDRVSSSVFVTVVRP